MSSSQESSLLSSGYEKLRTELSERTAEISKLRDQMSEQQQELERVYSKLQGQEEQHGSLEIINQELVCQLDEALTKGHYYYFTKSISYKHYLQTKYKLYTQNYG